MATKLPRKPNRHSHQTAIPNRHHQTSISKPPPPTKPPPNFKMGRVKVGLDHEKWQTAAYLYQTTMAHCWHSGGGLIKPPLVLLYLFVRPEPSFDRPAISEVPFRHRVLISQVSSHESALEICSRECVDTTSFSFEGSKLVIGASSSTGCSIYLESLPYQRLFHHSLVEVVPLSFPLFFFGMSYLYYPASLLPLVFIRARNLDSHVTDESATEGFTPDDLSKLCYRCAKLNNIADMILVYKFSEVGSSVPSAKRANDAEGSADNVDDADNQDDAHYHYVDNVNDLVHNFDLSFDRRTRKRVDPSLSSFCMCCPPIQTVLDVVQDALAQGAEGLGLMNNEDHQVLRKE
ncbi:hypothetical protein Tco_1417298 [Tanacetum coccineum]